VDQILPAAGVEDEDQGIMVVQEGTHNGCWAVKIPGEDPSMVRLEGVGEANRMEGNGGLVGLVEIVDVETVVGEDDLAGRRDQVEEGDEMGQEEDLDVDSLASEEEGLRMQEELVHLLVLAEVIVERTRF